MVESVRFRNHSPTCSFTFKTPRASKTGFNTHQHVERCNQRLKFTTTWLVLAPLPAMEKYKGTGAVAGDAMMARARTKLQASGRSMHERRRMAKRTML